jgi:hypothetical protein
MPRLLNAGEAIGLAFGLRSAIVSWSGCSGLACTQFARITRNSFVKPKAMSFVMYEVLPRVRSPSVSALSATRALYFLTVPRANRTI